MTELSLPGSKGARCMVVALGYVIVGKTIFMGWELCSGWPSGSIGGFKNILSEASSLELPF